MLNYLVDTKLELLREGSEDSYLTTMLQGKEFFAHFESLGDDFHLWS